MQLRKRINDVNYTENGSLPTSRPRGSNSDARDVSESPDSENDGTSDDTEEGSSGLENSDQTEELRSSKKKALASGKRKHGASRHPGLGKDNAGLVYRKRNHGDAGHATSQISHGEDGDGGDDDFVAVDKKPKKRKLLAEPRTRLLRARRSETVNYKDASSSDEGDGSSKGLDRSLGKAGRGHRGSSELVAVDDELAESTKPSYRKKGASNGKLRRVAAPSVESADSLPSKDGDGDPFKCYKRRDKSEFVIVSDEEDEQKAGVAAAEQGSGRNAEASPNGNSAEPEEKSRIRDRRHTKLSKDFNDAPDSAVEQPNDSLPVNLTAHKPPSKSSFYVVDMFGLRIGERDYGPITKRISKVEKIIAVRNRSTGAPIFCVKLQGKSYRSVVNVLEGQLQKHCSQLLRAFLKRMDLLDRKDGHPGDHARSPCFNPIYLKIDRIVTDEKHNRWTSYFVKWCGLSYSESTWERDNDLTDDADEIKRYNNFNRRKKKRQSAGSGSKLHFKDGRSLRDYQAEGVSWMDDKYQNEVNCILADEMGLGKTIQSVAMLETLRLKHAIQGPFLVVAPVSTLGHWQREVESLTDMNCVVYSGTQEDREIIRDYEFKYDSDSRSSDIKFNVLLTSFEMLMKDQTKLAKIKWQYVIVDEAHRLKSRESKTTLSLKQMGVPRGGLVFLTGTPVQNNTKEIFSLLHLLDSENFSSEEVFLTKYGDLKNAEQVKDLQDNVLRPRLLRRMKEDVEKTIPQKEETIVWVELTREQWVYYRAIYENSVGVLLKGSQGNNIPSLRNVAMELRKVCNHPLLCDGIEDDLMLKHSGSIHGHVSSKSGTNPDLALKLLQQSSGKMILVDKLLPMLKEAGNRVLIFSQFTMMLDLLEDYLVYKGYTYERIDGNIRGSERQAAIDRYSAKESDIFVFLLSTRAGGLGITLTAADTCLIYDSDWNPQNDLQAMARCHRIGQTKDVRIYRLITRNTYEQKLFEVSSRKYGLDEAILGNRLGADGDLEQTTNIETLLKHGAYDMVKDEGDAASTEFSTQNIHEILEHRTEKRLIGGRGVNTFSVARFISQTEVESDDRKQQLEKGAEEFWKDMLPEACKASKAAKEKVPSSPAGSKRKRVRVDYREDPKSLSDDETYEYNVGGSGRDSQTEESSVSVESSDDDGLDSWPEREVKRLEDRLMVLGRNRSGQIQQEAKLEHRSLLQVEQVSDFIVQLCYFFDSNKTSQASNTSQKSPDVDAKDQKQKSPDVDAKDQKQKSPDVDAKDQKLTEVGEGLSEVKSTEPEGVEKLTEVGEALSGVKSSEPEGISETLPLGCVVVNDHESGVNYRKDGCLLIGDRRRPTPPSCIRKAMKSRILVDRLAKNSSRYLQVLQEREILALAISKNDPRYLPPRVPLRTKKIPAWWGAQEDLDLMVGVNKHGHREFKKVRIDPSLCFAKRMQAAFPIDPYVLKLQEISQASGMITPCDPYPISNEGGDWPADSALAARLKKLIQILPKGSGLQETNKCIPKLERKRGIDSRWHRAEMTLMSTSWQNRSSGHAEKRESLVPAVTVTHVCQEAIQKVEVDVESLCCRTEAEITVKESEIMTKKPLLVNSDKKEAGLENSRQQRITGYFIPKVVVAS